MGGNLNRVSAIFFLFAKRPDSYTVKIQEKTKNYYIFATGTVSLIPCLVISLLWDESSAFLVLLFFLIDLCIILFSTFQHTIGYSKHFVHNNTNGLIITNVFLS